MKPIIKDSQLLIGRAFGQTFQRENATPDYVSIPPAAIITEQNGATWTLGNRTRDGSIENMEFIILRNGMPMGEFGSRIEMRGRRIRIWSERKWKHWNGRTFV